MATRKKRRIDGDVVDEITTLALNTRWTPAQIHREIERQFGEGSAHQRTVERIVKEERPQDESVPWNLADSEGDDARLVLETLRALTMEALADYVEMFGEETPQIARRTKLYRFSREAAAWLVKVRKVAPDLNPTAAWVVARLYQGRVQREADTSDLDNYLAFAPWRDWEHYHAYTDAVAFEMIPPAPLWARLVQAQRPELSPSEKELEKAIAEGPSGRLSLESLGQLDAESLRQLVLEQTKEKEFRKETKDNG